MISASQNEDDICLSSRPRGGRRDAPGQLTASPAEGVDEKLAGLEVIVTGDLAAEVDTEVGESAEVSGRVFLPELAHLVALLPAGLGGQVSAPGSAHRVRYRALQQRDQRGGLAAPQQDQQRQEAQEEGHAMAGIFLLMNYKQTTPVIYTLNFHT